MCKTEHWYNVDVRGCCKGFIRQSCLCTKSPDNNMKYNDQDDDYNENDDEGYYRE